MVGNRRSFGAWTAVVDPDVTETPCSEEPPPPRACGLPVYVNFDVNSATIRPESDQVLADLYDLLLADDVESVIIEGHTSTEGSEAYNLDLSERRAQSIVDDLISRGYSAGSITAAGLGETTPLISPDDDETSRELNRRGRSQLRVTLRSRSGDLRPRFLIRQHPDHARVCHKPGQAWSRFVRVSPAANAVQQDLSVGGHPGLRGLKRPLGGVAHGGATTGRDTTRMDERTGYVGCY